MPQNLRETEQTRYVDLHKGNSHLRDRTDILLAFFRRSLRHLFAHSRCSGSQTCLSVRKGRQKVAEIASHHQRSGRSVCVHARAVSSENNPSLGLSSPSLSLFHSLAFSASPSQTGKKRNEGERWKSHLSPRHCMQIHAGDNSQGSTDRASRASRIASRPPPQPSRRKRKT